MADFSKLNPPFLIPAEDGVREHTNLSWNALDTLFNTEVIDTPCFLAPPQTHWEVFYFAHCQKHRIPAVMLGAYNMPLNKKIIGETGRHTLITTPELFNALSPLPKEIQSLILITTESNTDLEISTSKLHTVPPPV